MIRLLLKLAVVALVANATWHVFNIYLPHYRLKDGVQSASQFRGDMSDDALREKILYLASQLDVPITESDVAIGHDAHQTTIDLSYERRVELAPGLTRRWPLSMHVETMNSRVPVPNELLPK